MREELKAKPTSYPRRLSPRCKVLLRLVACGLTVEESSKQIGVSYVWASKTVNSEAGRKYLESLENELDEQFKHLYSSVLKVLRDGLSSIDPKIALAAASLWLKASGKEKRVIRHELTAEDVVKQLMTQKMSGQPLQLPSPDAEGIEDAEFTDTAPDRGYN